VALRWFCSRSLLRHEGVTRELIDRIPGKQTDRKTPLGEEVAPGRRYRRCRNRNRCTIATDASSCNKCPIFMPACLPACLPGIVTTTSASQQPSLPSPFLRSLLLAAGELNWVFTAITDTIAWNVLPRALFQKLFRQDLLVASLFRNFLLAERIMRAANCNPVRWGGVGQAGWGGMGWGTRDGVARTGSGMVSYN
jgi:hypothetical protein